MNSRKRPIVFTIRHFPLGCGTLSNPAPSNLPPRSIKNPGSSNVDSAPKPKRTCLDLGYVVVAAPRTKGTWFQQDPDHDHDHLLAAPKPKGRSSLKQEPKFENISHDHLHRGPSAREKVIEALHVFKQVYRQLDQDKQARRGGDLYEATARIDIKTQAVLERMGKQVNTEKRIGLVPGIKVGDEFQYKTELRLVGLHFKTMCGIDYMKVGDEKLATSIVASEGYGYVDEFDDGVVVYTGEGGNVISKEKKTEDQKLVKGNLALANSMKRKGVVREIRGEERWDKKGKRYVYDGLYLVENYWLEREAIGKLVYKFKLCRIPGQPR
ncbi:unnamed protein product [Microthlaspi erraticum]|uniref:YDG domain-containing protein n=1 Tax=Microthlaspi erraticum TaxID=1685480 RepID=A0A6D2K0M8_9BRAS|nr:unnamed protein product [Microthlaspi erraticum]